MKILYCPKYPYLLRWKVPEISVLLLQWSTSLSISAVAIPDHLTFQISSPTFQFLILIISTCPASPPLHFVFFRSYAPTLQQSPLWTLWTSEGEMHLRHNTNRLISFSVLPHSNVNFKHQRQKKRKVHIFIKIPFFIENIHKYEKEP